LKGVRFSVGSGSTYAYGVLDTFDIEKESSILDENYSFPEKFTIPLRISPLQHAEKLYLKYFEKGQINPTQTFNNYNKKYESDMCPDIKFAKGTTTLAFVFKGGVVVAVDSRSTMGPYIASQSVKKSLKLILICWVLWLVVLLIVHFGKENLVEDVDFMN